MTPSKTSQHSSHGTATRSTKSVACLTLFSTPWRRQGFSGCGCRRSWTDRNFRRGHALIWDRLDKALAKHRDMVLLHGGSPKGAERIAACWADSRKVPQIAFRPDWARHDKAAPFKRNDAMLDVLPIGVLVFPGTGIQDNLADKARKMGIPVWRAGDTGA
jgi:hypothetical protein